MQDHGGIYILKVVLIGEPAVGKTSLIHQYVQHAFDDQYLTTLGIGVTKRTETFPSKAGRIQVRLSIWDIMGNRKVMEHLGDAYFDGAGGALAVFDVTRPDTLEGLKAWIKAVRRAESRVPILVLGNKTDLADLRVVTDEEAGQLCQSLGLPYLPTSARTGPNVEPAFRRLVREALRTFTPIVPT